MRACRQAHHWPSCAPSLTWTPLSYDRCRAATPDKCGPQANAQAKLNRDHEDGERVGRMCRGEARSRKAQQPWLRHNQCSDSAIILAFHQQVHVDTRAPMTHCVPSLVRTLPRAFAVRGSRIIDNPHLRRAVGLTCVSATYRAERMQDVIQSLSKARTETLARVKRLSSSLMYASASKDGKHD